MRDDLLRWYDNNGRDLPMRASTVTPWGTLVGEVMSQQTPMPRVQPIWQRWMRRWPTPQALAQASPAEVLVEWDRLGYPSRALRLRECAVQIAALTDGTVPSSVDELIALPGIGPYTASAVASFSYRQRVPVLDTNIRRVLVRIFDGVERPVSSSPSRAETTRATELLPKDGEECALWNVALMELGALVCTSRSPKCNLCPVSDHCAWLKLGQPALEGVKMKTQSWKGTDRQARGRVMALLRRVQQDKENLDEGAAGFMAVSISRAEALQAATLADSSDIDQPARVVDGLIRDGLVAADADSGQLSLPL